MKLDISNLNINIKNNNNFIKILDGIDLTIESGETVALLGESGSGKSMTANAILQILPNNASVANKSSIVFNSENLLNKSEYQMQAIRRNNIAIVFQDPMTALNPVFTIGEQLLEVLKLKHKDSRKNLLNKVVHLLKEVGLSNPERQCRAYPHELSGGMRQRVVIAMALAHEPSLLLADEPTTALDVTIQLQILELLKKLQRKYNMSMLFITHNIAIVEKIADRVAVIHEGKIIELADTKQLLTHPKHIYTKEILSAQLNSKKSIYNINQNQEKICLQVDRLSVLFPIYKGLFQRVVDNIIAVDNISFKLFEKTTLAIVGESGSGKTSIAKALMNLLPYSGVVNSHNNLMQIIFQNPYSALNPKMLVLDIINESHESIYKHKLSIRSVQNLLRQIGLSDSDIYKYPHQFSGGQRQRVAIARAIAVKPKILILDEPTSALDAPVQKQVLNLLTDLQQEHGLSYVLISHDLSVVGNLADYVAVMYRGKIVEYGTVYDILKNPKHSYTQTLLGSSFHVSLSNTSSE